VEPQWDCPGDDTCKKLQRYLTKHLKGDVMDGSYAEFTFVGRFKDMHKPKPRFGEYSFALYITNMTDGKSVEPPSTSDKQKPASRFQPTKSLDRSHGNPEASGIKRDPAKVLGSAVARSTQPLGCLIKPTAERLKKVARGKRPQVASPLDQ
jgi:hypothetical protein